MNQPDLHTVASCFDLPGRFMSGAPHGSGHINDTFAVGFDDGGNRVRYVLQRVNHEVFKDVPAVMENVDRATRHITASLERQDVPDRSRRSMTLIPARDGSTYHVTPGGDYWRAFHFIEGATSYDVLTTHNQAYEVARAFGSFQTMLADLPEPPLHETIPRFHDGPDRFRAFVDAVEQDPLNRADGARPEIAFLMENAAAFDRLPALISSGALPLRATHNDCKSNNVLIDDATGEGICVIDLDTLMPGLVLYDFGDMVRTSTCAVAEDSQDLDRVQMDLERFKYLTHGYLASAGEFLTPAEMEQLVFAGRVITLTIGARFLTDHLLGDTYFKTHRPNHNLDRSRVQFALVRSILRQEPAMYEVVEQAASRREVGPR
jgi:aminoglycoside phosphotransferase (APT) family kinase protein